MVNKTKEFNYAKVERYIKVRENYRKKEYQSVEINFKKFMDIELDFSEVRRQFKKSFAKDIKIIEYSMKLKNLFDEELGLPNYCGPGLDSVEDCFHDKDWTKNKKIVLLIKDIKKFLYEDMFLGFFSDIHELSKKSNFKFDVWIFEND